MDRDRYTPWHGSPANWYPQNWLLVGEALLCYVDSHPDINDRGGWASAGRCDRDRPKPTDDRDTSPSRPAVAVRH